MAKKGNQNARKKESEKLVKLTATITKDDMAYLQKWAEDHGVTVSAALRMIISFSSSLKEVEEMEDTIND